MSGFYEKHRTLIIAAVLAAAAALRLLYIGKLPFFIDEVHAILFTKGSLLDAMRLLRETPGTAPLDYALVNLLSHISTNEAFIRLPYAAAGVASVYFTFRLCERWHGTESAFHAALLMTLSAAHIFYSQSIRCYSLGILLIILVVDSHDRYFNHRQQNARNLFIASSALSIINQFFMLIPVSFLLLGAFLSARKAKQSDTAKFREDLITIAAASAVICFILIFTWRLILTPKGLGIMSESLKPFVLVILLVKIFATFASMRFWVPCAAIFALFIFGLFYTFKHSRRTAVLILLTILAPAPFIIFQEMRIKSGAHMRHYIYALPFYFIVASQGLKWFNARLHNRANTGRIMKLLHLNMLPAPVVSGSVFAFLVLSLLPSVKSYYSSPFGYNGSECDLRPDLRTPAIALTTATNSSDILIASGIADGAWRYVIDFYLDKNNAKRNWIPFTEIESISPSPEARGRILFVYFDFPYFFERDFSGYSNDFKVARLNDFITIFEPVVRIKNSSELAAASEKLAYLVAPPSDYRFFAREFTFLGVVARMKGDMTASRRHIERAIDVSHNGILKVATSELEARNELGVTLYRTGELLPAGEQWDAAERLIPPNISLALLKQLDLRPENLTTNRALYFLSIGDRHKAGIYVSKALAYNQMYKPALKLRERLKGSASGD